MSWSSEWPGGDAGIMRPSLIRARLRALALQRSAERRLARIDASAARRVRTR